MLKSVNERSEHDHETVRLLFELVPGLSDHIQHTSPKKLRELTETVGIILSNMIYCTSRRC